MFIHDDGTPGTYEENVNYFLISEFDKYLKKKLEENHNDQPQTTT